MVRTAARTDGNEKQVSLQHIFRLSGVSDLGKSAPLSRMPAMLASGVDGSLAYSLWARCPTSPLAERSAWRRFATPLFPAGRLLSWLSFSLCRCLGAFRAGLFRGDDFQLQPNSPRARKHLLITSVKKCQRLENNKCVSVTRV